MSAVVGGSITALRYNSPLFGSGQFLPFGDAEGEFEIGGIITVDESRVAGGQNLVTKEQYMAGYLTIEVQQDMAVQNEIAQAYNLMRDPETTWTALHINGTVWGGVGVVVAPLTMNAMTSSFTIKVVCAQGFTKQ